MIYRTVPSSTRADTLVANATTKKINEQDTKTFSKCYVGRNGKRNQQKLHIQVCGSLCVFSVCVGGEGMGRGDLRQPSPVICKSHEL